MEIERKFLVKEIPENLNRFERLDIIQGYIFFSPTVRLRKQNDQYIFTAKSKGMFARDEFEMELSKEDFDRMWKKVEGHPIEKSRYKIPIEHGLICELDIFMGNYNPLVVAEVEFESIEAANRFMPLPWFGEEVTFNKSYSNNNLAIKGFWG